MSATFAATKERQEEIALLEELLDVRLPPSYRRFVYDQGAGTVLGLPVLGVPVSLDLTSAWGATAYLRSKRPDLEPGLIAIRIVDDRALCLDVRDGVREDAEMVEVSLSDNQSARPLGVSFLDYLNAATDREQRVSVNLERIRVHLANQARNRKSYDHKSGARQPPFKARDWRVIRSCVHDRVVGLVALRHDRRRSELEVDVFISTDHPDYEPGHGCRGLLIVLLSDAYRNGASMSISFTDGPVEGGRRYPARIPNEIVRLAESIGVRLSAVDKGQIRHPEAVELYAGLVGISSKLRDEIRGFEDAGRFSLLGLAYLIGSRIWTQAQALWFLQNAARPEGILFGVDTPEQRPAYEEALLLGRAVLGIERLCQRLRHETDEANWEESDTTVTPEGLLWRLTCVQKTTLDWAVGGRPLVLHPGQSILVLASPRRPFPWEDHKIRDDAKALASLSDGSLQRCLLYSSDVTSIPNMPAIADEVRREHCVEMLVMPASIRDLDPEIAKRMAQAGRLRR